MKATSLVKNTVYLTVASTMQKAIAFLYFTYLSNYFGASTTGAYFVALGIITTIAVFEDVGLTSVLVREVAKGKVSVKKLLGAVVGVKLFTIPLILLAAVFGLDVLGEVLGWLPDAPVIDAEVKLYVQLGVGLLIADTLSLSFYGVLRGVKDLRFESLGIFIGQLLTAGIGATLIFTGQATLPLILLALTVGSTWNMFFAGFVLVRKVGLSAFVPNFTFAKPMLKMASAFFIGALFVKLMSYFDSVLILLFSGKEEVGQYAVAYKFTYAFQFLPLVFVAALYPEMSSHDAHGERLRKITLDSFWYMAFIGAPIVFGLWSIAPALVDTFYDLEEFGPSIAVLQLLIFVLFFIFFDFPLGSLLNAKDRQITKTIITGIALAVNVVANIILVPRFGAIGASTAALLTFSTMLTLDWIYARDLVDLTLWDVAKRVGPLLVSGLIMGLVVVALRSAVPLMVSIATGAITYLVVAYLLGGLKGEYLGGLRKLAYGKKK